MTAGQTFSQVSDTLRRTADRAGLQIVDYYYRGPKHTEERPDEQVFSLAAPRDSTVAEILTLAGRTIIPRNSQYGGCYRLDTNTGTFYPPSGAWLTAQNGQKT